jgi:peptide/nickel transport system substrate-binding protein
MTRPLLLVLVVGLLASGCRAARPMDTDLVVVGIAVAPNNLDPRIGSDEASQRVHQLLHATLMRLDDDLRVVPEVAERLEQRDARTYVASLRQDVSFHDGRPLRAADVAFTFRSLIAPDFVSPRKGAYRLLEAVEVEDEYTFVFRLREPFGSFPVNLVMGIVPDGTPPGAPDRIGAGPYRFERMVADDRIEVRRFDGYFDGPAVNAGLILRIIPDDTMRGLELRTGAIDLVINDLSPDIAWRLHTDGYVQMVTAPGVDYAYVGINLRDPLLGDPRVRRALAHAVDTSAIIAHLRRGLASPAAGVLPPMSWAYAADASAVPYDPAAAARLLDEAGYPDPDGPGPLPRLRLTMKTSTAEFVRLQGAVIQQDLAKVGIALELRSLEFATLYGDVLAGNFQLFTLQWVGVTDPDMLRRVFHSAQMPPNGFNRGFFTDAEVDRLIDEATTATDDTARGALYVEAQARIAAATPYVSLWHKTNAAVAQHWIDDVRLTPQASFAALRHVRKRRPS